MEETARGEEFSVCARKIIQQNCMDKSQRTKNQWQEIVNAMNKNDSGTKLIVEGKFNVHEQPSRKMLPVCTWC